MRGVFPLIVGVTTLLAACGEKHADKPVDPITGSQTVAQVKAQARKVQLRPGQWESMFTMDSLDLSNMPAGAPSNMAEQMKRMMTRTIRYCVTPEQAANPDGRMFSGQENKDCTYSGFDANGGVVKGQIACGSQGGTMTAVMSGTYAPEKYEMHMDMKQAGGPAGMAMAMKATTSGKRVGATCSGT
jgi:hypothetical protein